MIVTLKNILADARDGDYAIGHFNFADSITLRAIVEACVEAKSPIFVGTSEGEAKFLGYAYAAALRDGARRATGLPVFLNADHHKSFESAKIAIDAGYDSIQIDGTELTQEENIVVTKQVTEYAHSFWIYIACILPPTLSCVRIYEITLPYVFPPRRFLLQKSE